MAEILVGTCGYHYVEWIGPVYPEGTKKEDFLAYYARMFPALELDYTYYAMPTAGQLEGMMEKAGPSLIFSAKAHETLTHRVDPGAWEGEAKTYLTALEPLMEAGRLGAVLFQFPYSFHYEPDQRRYLDKLLAYFKERHPCWKTIGSIGIVESSREVKGEITVERRHFVSSLPADGPQFAKAVRCHWGYWGYRKLVTLRT